MKIRMLILAALLAASPALSDEHRPGPHGGRIGNLGPFFAELVVSDRVVDLYLMDGDRRAMEVSGYKAIATLRAGGKSEEVSLEPADDKSKLTGTASVSLPARVRGTVQLMAADGQSRQGRFDDD